MQNQNTNKKTLSRTLLANAIDDFLYVSKHGKTVLLGIGCVLSSFSYAQQTDLTRTTQDNSVVSTLASEPVQQVQSQKTVEQKVEIQQEQSILDESVEQFQEDAVYQLKDSDIPAIDQDMLKEIEQVAQQAQQEAQQQTEQIISVTEAIQQQKSIEIQTTSEELSQQVVVDNLIKTLETQQIRPSEFELSDTPEEKAESPDTTNSSKQRGFFSRFFHRNDDEFIATIPKFPRIDVTVTGAPKELENNIKAKLSIFTVDAFENFNAALPQLKTITVQAAQAVGYFSAEFKFNKMSDHQLEVVVTPHNPVIVRSQNIEFFGDGAKRPAFQVVSVVPDLTEGDVFNQGLYQTTKSRITTAADEQGYFDAYWRMHDAKVSLPEDIVDINLKYETGERYQLHDVEFRMSDTNKPFPLRMSVLKKLAPFKDGDDYTSWRINLLSNNLINSRYFNYALVNALKPDPIEKPLDLPDDVKQQMQAVSQSTTEEIQDPDVVENQDVVNEDVFAGIDLKSKDQMLNDSTSIGQELLENEKLKAQARIDKKIPVIVYLNADKLNNLETGIGYGTDTGIRLRTQYFRSIVNDRGHSFDANFEVSEIRQSIDGRYMIPYKDPLNDYFTIIGGYERDVRNDVGQGVELDIESAIMGVERSIKRPLGEWQHNLSIRYQSDSITRKGNVDYNDLPDAFKVVNTSPQQSLLFGYELNRTDQNKRVNPTQGFRQFYRVDVGSESVLTETDLAILNAGWRFIYSLGENADYQFVGRGDLGYIITQDFDKVPYNLRYFAGGDQSIRGFDYESLSTKEDGLLIGGQVLAVGSLEYNYQFKEGWRAALFTDIGNAYDKNFQTPTEYSVGIGMRWASPVGPIRLDVAAGISESSVPIRLHFFIGPAL